LENLESYVEMVAGLPINEQKMKIFCKSNKRSYGIYKHIKIGQNAMLNFPTENENESCSSSSNESNCLLECL
jgi:hypothetical protein